jgi:hypothetical protein
MLKAIKQKNGNQTAQAAELPAPVGGWNARDALGSMPPTDAIQLINWFPRQSDVALRPGYRAHCDTGTGKSIERMWSYQIGDKAVLYSYSDGKIFDCTLPAPAMARGNLTGGDYVSSQLNNALIMVNGADVPLQSDGTFISDAAFTAVGLDLKKLNYVFTFKSRMYFVEAGTQRFWYGDVSSIAGPLQKFDLSLTRNFTGELMLLTAITNDGGDGKDDLFVGIFSEGDVVVYQGSDPGGTDWNHVGTYKIGSPLSRHSVNSTGSDIRVLTTRGYESLVRSTREGEGVRNKSLMSEKIQGIVSHICGKGPAVGWEISIHQHAQMMIVNIPRTATKWEQHVQNINTGSWCQFDIKDARCFHLIKRKIYMGSPKGIVHIFGEGENDNGTDIKTTMQLGWNYFGIRQNKKIIHLLRFLLTGSYFPSISVQIGVDYGKHKKTTTLNVGIQEDPFYWGESYWDEAYWSTGVRTKEYWHDHGVEGRCFSLRLTTSGHKGNVALNAVTFIYDRGGLI